MCNKRIALLPAIAVIALLLLVPWPGLASADEADIRLKGFADVPGTSLSLPVASTVTINITFGIPSVTIPVQITASTQIKSELAPVTLADGDRVKVKARVVGDALVASKLEVEAFPEVEVIGTVVPGGTLPAGGVMLPLPAGTTVDFMLQLVSGVNLPIRLTSSTKVEGSMTIMIGDTVEVEAAVSDNRLVATRVGAEREDANED
jgi:Domain of unknown function (DUF5666)